MNFSFPSNVLYYEPEGAKQCWLPLHTSQSNFPAHCEEENVKGFRYQARWSPSPPCRLFRRLESLESSWCLWKKIRKKWLSTPTKVYSNMDLNLNIKVQAAHFGHVIFALRPYYVIHNICIMSSAWTWAWPCWGAQAFSDQQAVRPPGRKWTRSPSQAHWWWSTKTATRPLRDVGNLCHVM